MAVDCTRALLLMVGLGRGVAVRDVGGRSGGPLEVEIELTGRPCCGGCGAKVHRHGAGEVRLADLPVFGRAVRLVWRKRRWLCPHQGCAVRTFTDQDPRIAPPRGRVTARAARWATRRAGAGRAVKEIAAELGCNWHTAMAAVQRWGRALLEADVSRVEGVTALGLDEILMFRRGRYREQQWATTIVDARGGKLLDIVPGRSAKGAKRWIQGRTPRWRRRMRWGVMDLSGPYRKAFTDSLPKAIQVADPFHVVKLANSAVDEVRRRVQNETTGGRGTKDDPLYRIRRLLTKAHERVTERGEAKLRGLLAAGDPRGEALRRLARQRNGPHDLPHPRSRTRARSPRRALPRPARPDVPARTEQARPHASRLAGTERQLASLTRHQRTDRSSQQPGQANQASVVRNHQLRPLPNPSPALCRQARLEPARHPHPTLKREEPTSSACATEQSTWDCDFSRP